MDRVHRINGVRPSRRALAILPRPSPLSQSLMKHVQIVLFKQAMTLHARRGSRAKFLQGIRDREHHIRRLRMPMIITFVSRHFLLNYRFAFYW